MASLKVFCTLVTTSRDIKSQQSYVTRILESKHLSFESMDISLDNVREEMRTKSGNPKACPPQIFNGDEYCGDYEMFKNAVEDYQLNEFLKLKE